MLTEEQPYQEYLDSRFQDLETVCTVGAWQIESASAEGTLLLVMVNHEANTAALCRYASLFERSDDIELLLRLPPGGEAEAGVFAWLKPTPPTLSGSKARPFPPPTKD